jgi:hypothetical protein
MIGAIAPNPTTSILFALHGRIQRDHVLAPCTTTIAPMTMIRTAMTMASTVILLLESSLRPRLKETAHG